VDHVIAPLDTDHARVVGQLSVDLAAALSIDLDDVALRPPHITLASYTGLEPPRAATALAPVLAVTAPFAVRAHGYGLFTGDADTDLSLHVMVVRTKALDELHRCVTTALCGAGAHLAGTTESRVWTPHITLLDRGLSPRSLGRAVEMLAGRPHRTWSITLESLAVTHHCGDADAGPLTMELGGATRVCRRRS
jgi:2'-5' RNA ligase